MATRGRYLLGPLAVVAVLGLAAASLLVEVVEFDPPWSALVLVLDVRVLLWLAVGFFASGLALYGYYFRREDGDRFAPDGRPVEAIVPVYRDAAAMHRSVESLVAADYGDLSVTLVVEPDDGASLRRARELAREHPIVECLVNEKRQGSKAGAINLALERGDAPVVALFDADQRPHPKLLGHAMAYLDEHDVARVRNMPDPSGGVIESMAYYEYLLLFFLPQKVARFVLGFNLAGTRSILIERSVFEEVGTFDEGTLTEDFDFAHRIHSSECSVTELLHYPTLEEPAHSLRDWWGQRVRWMTGQTEVGRARVREVRDLFDRELLASLSTIAGTFVAGSVMATTLPKVALGLATAPLVVGAGLLALAAVVLATRLLDDRTAALTGFGPGWLLVPVALTLYGLVIVEVVLEAAAGVDTGWYSAEKVEE